MSFKDPLEQAYHLFTKNKPRMLRHINAVGKSVAQSASGINNNYYSKNGAIFEKFLDVKKFTAEELSVKVNHDATVTVEGKHEATGKQNEIFTNLERQFRDEFVVPRDYYDVGKIEARLSPDGVLRISAPKKEEKGARIVYVQKCEEDLRSKL